MATPTDPPSTFPGFASPSFTQVPDELFDVLMPALADCELRVLLYIIRRTFGFKRDADAISLSQMVAGITTKDGKVLDRGTGLSKATVARGLSGLREKGVIEAERNASRERGHEATTYRLKFKSESSEIGAGLDPLSQPRDKGHSAPLVSAVRQGLSRQRDTQETVKQHTDFEYSKGKTLVENKEADERSVHPSGTQPDQTGSSRGMQPLGTLVARRTPRRGEREDHLAIATTIEALAAELGDRASHKATVSRAMNLFANAGLGRDAFLDLLYQAKGEVRDRRRDPGNAPLPRNQMAYFFAVVEDRLGLRETAVNASISSASAWPRESDTACAGTVGNVPGG